MKLSADIYTTTQLLSLFDPTGAKRVSSVWIGRELKKAGFHQVNGGAVVLTNKGPQRMYAIRNAKKWLRAKPKDLAIHWNLSFAQETNDEKKRKF
jgi:hypothetical protein